MPFDWLRVERRVERMLRFGGRWVIGGLTCVVLFASATLPAFRGSSAAQPGVAADGMTPSRDEGDAQGPAERGPSDATAASAIDIVGRLSYAPELDTQTCTFPADENNATALAYDREAHLFVGCNTSPARIVKVELATLRRVGALTLGEGEAGTRIGALIALQPDLVIHGSYTNPCVFTRVDGRTMQKTGSLPGTVQAVNDKYIRPMVFDGRYVYAGCDS